MRNLLIVILTVFIFISGCKKAEILETQLEGRWELRLSSSMVTTTYAPGSGNILEFTGDQYVLYVNGQRTESGGFSIVKDYSASASTCTVIPANEYEDRIIYMNYSFNRKIFFRINSGKLQFITGCFAFDGGLFQEYEKL